MQVTKQGEPFVCNSSARAIAQTDLANIANVILMTLTHTVIIKMINKQKYY